MTVGDLTFKLSVSGADNVQDEIQDISDKLLQLQSLATSLDGKEIDIEANIDQDGSLRRTVETTRRLGEAVDDLGDGPEVEVDAPTVAQDLDQNLDEVEFEPQVDVSSVRSRP